MEKINKIKSRIVPLNIENVDTDQIIPARFLKTTNKTGFGDHLFYDWRYDSEGMEKPDFPLNNRKYNGVILLAGKNFGCGSSREHAAWAIKEYGFKIVISIYFADIFKGNALNNGILPIEVSEEYYEDLLEELMLDNEIELSIDLEKQEVSLIVSGLKEQFDINPYKKECLLNGIDDLDYLVSLRDEIKEFENEYYEV